MLWSHLRKEEEVERTETGGGKNEVGLREREAGLFLLPPFQQRYFLCLVFSPPLFVVLASNKMAAWRKPIKGKVGWKKRKRFLFGVVV